MKIDALEDGADDDNGWNIEGSGVCSIILFSNAVQVWASAQDRLNVTIDEAALAFNVTPVIITQAVESHYWMYLDGNTIQHEGE